MNLVAATPMSIVEAITRKPAREVRDVFYNCVTGYLPTPKGTLPGGRQLHSADIVGVGPTALRIEARYHGGNHLPLIKHCADLYGPGLAALAAGVAAIDDIPVEPWPSIFPVDSMILATTHRPKVTSGPGIRDLSADRPLVAPGASHPASKRSNA